MKKLLLLGIVLFLLAIPVVQSQQDRIVCGDFIDLRQNCTFVTPTISCASFTYDIFNKTGENIIDDAPLTQFNDSIFEFNFTLVTFENQYIITLCDGTTREVTVQAGGREGNTMSFIAISLLMGFTMGLLAWMSFNLTKAVTSDSEADGKWVPIRVLFLIVSMLIALGGINISRIIAQDTNMPIGITNMLSTFYTVGIITLMFVGFISFAYYILIVINYFSLRRSDGGGGRFDR